MSSNPPLSGVSEDGASALLLDTARALHENGQESSETQRTVKALGDRLRLKVDCLLEWGSITIVVDDVSGSQRTLVAEAQPSAVMMNRVEAVGLAAAALHDDLRSRRAFLLSVHDACIAPPAPLWMFVLACAAGASALSIIFGAQHPQAVILIAVGAAFTAFVRRMLAHHASGVVLQGLGSSLIAGLLGAMAVRLHISSELRLVAVCQCMILVPGPHLLNGALDLTYMRIPLGLARLTFACLILVAISTGLLVGLHLGGSDLPVSAPGRDVKIWLDVLAAGVAAASYSVYFSTPPSILLWPIGTGMIAHAARWYAMTVLGASAPFGAGLACIIVALILVPVAKRRNLPFAAIGFASVVSLMPGVFIFRMTSGLMALNSQSIASSPQILDQTLADGLTSILIVLCMGIGLVLPKRGLDALTRRRRADL